MCLVYSPSMPPAALSYGNRTPGNKLATGYYARGHIRTYTCIYTPRQYQAACTVPNHAHSRTRLPCASPKLTCVYNPALRSLAYTSPPQLGRSRHRQLARSLLPNTRRYRSKDAGSSFNFQLASSSARPRGPAE